MYLYNLGQALTFVCREKRDKTAIIFDGKDKITFRSLNLLSNKISNYLINRGINKNDVIAIQNRKSPIGFATMSACLKLGVIYTNFDYTNPLERLKKIFQTAAPELVIADEYNSEIKKLCKETAITYTVLSEDILGQESIELDDNLLNNVSEANPAYIMFTSGSTGIPKGVLISHRSLLNFIEWGRNTYHLEENDIMTNVNPIYFDNSVFDFYCSIFNGITMAAFSSEIVGKPKEMLQMIHDVQCTFWFSVPSMLIYLTNLKLLTQEILKSIRIFSFGGEGYPKELFRKLYKIYSEQADFYNVYGPTEGTCICSAYKVQKKDVEEEGLLPLGQIADNFDYAILNEHGEEKRSGELCLRGSQLALGYYNDLERTQKAFVQYRSVNAYPCRMYRTGDLVEVREGKLYFLGRSDNQIKHMGYRIELEEIESNLIKIEGVKQCAVVHTLSKNNLSKLAAFVATDTAITEQEMRCKLQSLLPGYMIPNRIYFMDELPKNMNGKVDRQALIRMI